MAGRDLVVADQRALLEHRLQRGEPDLVQASIVAIDVATHRVRDAGTLTTAQSDAALVNANGRLLLIGGRTANATLATVSRLTASNPVQERTSTLFMTAPTHQPTRRGNQAPSLIYVPNSMSNTVDVIDPATYTVIDHFDVGALPQHVTPSWDFTTLYVDNDHGNSLTPIDPRTGKRRGPISRSPIPTTCTSPPTVGTRSLSPKLARGSTSETRTA